MHDAEIGGHQGAGFGEKVIFHLALPFDGVAEHVEDRRRRLVPREDGRDALATGNEGQRGRLGQMDACDELAVCRRSHKDPPAALDKRPWFKL